MESIYLALIQKNIFLIPDLILLVQLIMRLKLEKKFHKDAKKYFYLQYLIHFQNIQKGVLVSTFIEKLNQVFTIKQKYMR